MKNIFALLSLLSAPCLAFAASPLLETPITYHPAASVEEKVKSECQIESMLADEVGSQLKRFYRTENVLLEKGNDPAGSPVLRLQITHILGIGGGAWTGPKAITVSAELTSEDGEVRKTKINRWSIGGVWGGFRGTCSILRRCAISIGKDLGRWTKDPSFKIKEMPIPNESDSSAPIATQESEAEPPAPLFAPAPEEERPTSDKQHAPQ